MSIIAFGIIPFSDAVPLKKTTPSQELPTTLVWFSLSSPKTSEEKDVTFAWPSGIKSKTILGLQVEFKASTGAEGRFVLKQPLPFNWKKGEQLQIPIQFLYPEMTKPKPGSQTRFQAQLILKGVINSKGTVEPLSQAILTANVNLPPSADCKPLLREFIVHSIEKDPIAFYQCTNQGKGPLMLSAIWSCNSPLVTIHSDPIQVGANQQGALTANVKFSKIEQSEFICQVKLQTNNPQPIDQEFTFPVKIIRSPFSLQLSPTSESEQAAKLFVRSATEWGVQIPAIPVDTKNQVTIQVQTISATEIEEISLLMNPKPGEELPFQIKVQDHYSFQIIFTPQLDNHLYEQAASIRIRYRDAQKNSREYRIPMVIIASTQIEKRVLPRKVFDVCTNKTKYDYQTPCFQNSYLENILELSLEDTKIIHSTLIGNVGTVEKSGEQFFLTPIPFEKMTKRTQSYFAPMINSGRLLAYRKTKDPLVLEQIELPISFRYRPDPIGISLHLAFGPGAFFSSETLPNWNLQASLYKQWQPYIDSNHRRLIVGLGLETFLGTNYKSLPVIADSAKSSIPMVGVDVALRLGGDLLPSQKLGLFLSTGLGYGYITPSVWLSNNEFLGHQFHFFVSPELRFRLWNSLPGLYLFVKPTLDLFTTQALITTTYTTATNTYFAFRFPLGIQLEW